MTGWALMTYIPGETETVMGVSWERSEEMARYNRDRLNGRAEVEGLLFRYRLMRAELTEVSS